MIHQRLERDLKLTFSIPGKSVEEQQKAIDQTDILFLCLKPADCEQMITKIKWPESLVVFTTGPHPWPLEIPCEKLLLLPSVYGNIGRGTHLIYSVIEPSEKAGKVIESLTKKLGEIILVKNYDSIMGLGIESAITPALVAQESVNQKCKPSELSEKSIEKIAILLQLDKAQVKMHLEMVEELEKFFGNLEDIPKSVATQGGYTEKLLIKLNTI